ncbi:MAG TPA: hypothetical protein VF756_24665, partial [Thermoanaerobaculia bacterium]
MRLYDARSREEPKARNSEAWSNHIGYCPPVLEGSGCPLGADDKFLEGSGCPLGADDKFLEGNGCPLGA